MSRSIMVKLLMLSVLLVGGMATLGTGCAKASVVGQAHYFVADALISAGCGICADTCPCGAVTLCSVPQWANATPTSIPANATNADFVRRWKWGQKNPWGGLPKGYYIVVMRSDDNSLVFKVLHDKNSKNGGESS